MKKKSMFLHDVTIPLLAICLFGNANCMKTKDDIERKRLIAAGKLKPKEKISISTSTDFPPEVSSGAQSQKTTGTTNSSTTKTKSAKITPATSTTSNEILEKLLPFALDVNMASDKDILRKKIVTLLTHLLVDAYDFLTSSSSEENRKLLLSLIEQIDSSKYDRIIATIESHMPGADSHQTLLNEMLKLLSSQNSKSIKKLDKKQADILLAIIKIVHEAKSFPPDELRLKEHLQEFQSFVDELNKLVTKNSQGREKAILTLLAHVVIDSENWLIKRADVKKGTIAPWIVDENLTQRFLKELISSISPAHYAQIDEILRKRSTPAYTKLNAKVAEILSEENYNSVEAIGIKDNKILNIMYTMLLSIMYPGKNKDILELPNIDSPLGKSISSDKLSNSNSPKLSNDNSPPSEPINDKDISVGIEIEEELVDEF
ncbi:MAG: hypothetical protein LBT70_04365 [Holosporaceae bacterium]|jgi:hypothetical protein|nr:hypothetical protein [Holosporaceae bacterium]